MSEADALFRTLHIGPRIKAASENGTTAEVFCQTMREALVQNPGMTADIAAEIGRRVAHVLDPNLQPELEANWQRIAVQELVKSRSIGLLPDGIEGVFETIVIEAVSSGDSASILLKKLREAAKETKGRVKENEGLSQITRINITNWIDGEVMNAVQTAGTYRDAVNFLSHLHALINSVLAEMQYAQRLTFEEPMRAEIAARVTSRYKPLLEKHAAALSEITKKEPHSRENPFSTPLTQPAHTADEVTDFLIEDCVAQMLMSAQPEGEAN